MTGIKLGCQVLPPVQTRLTTKGLNRVRSFGDTDQSLTCARNWWAGLLREFRKWRINDDIFEEEAKTSVHMEKIRQMQAKTIDFTIIHQNI